MVIKGTIYLFSLNYLITQLPNYYLTLHILLNQFSQVNRFRDFSFS